MKAEIKERIEQIKNGEVPNGYKKTKVGIIPQEWEVEKLGNIGKVKTGSTPLRTKITEYYYNGNIPWIKTLDLNNSYILNTEEKITEKALKETSCNLIKRNSLLIAMYGGFNQIGRTGINTIDATTNQAISSIEIEHSQFKVEYLLNILNLRVDDWKNIAASSRKDPNITKNDVEKFEIAFPKLQEQTQIALILSTWDTAIEKQQKLIELKKEQKKWLMQELLTGKKRLNGFSGEWKEIRLDKIFLERNEKTIFENQYEMLTSSREGIFLQKDYFNQEVITKTNIGYKIIYKKDFVFRSMSDDKIFVFNMLEKYDVGIVSPAYGVFFCQNGNTDFFKYWLNSSASNKYIEPLLQGGTRLALKYKNIKEIKANIPSIEEQKAIAEILITADQEVNLLEKELEAMKEQKKGLMQLLLTGIVRV